MISNRRVSVYPHLRTFGILFLSVFSLLLAACGEVAGPRDTPPAVGSLVIETDTVIELGTLGGYETGPLDLNAQSQVVGWSRIADGSVRAFLWSPASGMRNLGTLGGQMSTANAVNDSGHVAGMSLTPARVWHAFIWTPSSGMQDIGTMGGMLMDVRDLNNSGVMVGVVERNGVRTAFRWSATSGVSYLRPITAGGTSEAYSINEAGVVVGRTGNCTTCSTVATLWHSDTIPVFIHPAYYGYNDSRALAVNDSNQVVGFANGGRNKAFVWPAGDPNAVYCSGSPGAETDAQDINNLGLIAGSSVNYAISPVRTLPVICDLNGQTTGLPLKPGIQEAMALRISEDLHVLGQGWDAYRRSRALLWTID